MMTKRSRAASFRSSRFLRKTAQQVFFAWTCLKRSRSGSKTHRINRMLANQQKAPANQGRRKALDRGFEARFGWRAAQVVANFGSSQVINCSENDLTANSPFPADSVSNPAFAR
jgi:hypothetical protein